MHPVFKLAIFMLSSFMIHLLMYQSGNLLKQWRVPKTKASKVNLRNPVKLQVVKKTEVTKSEPEVVKEPEPNLELPKQTKQQPPSKKPKPKTPRHPPKNFNGKPKTKPKKATNFYLSGKGNLEQFYESEGGKEVLSNFKALPPKKKQDVSFNYDLLSKRIDIPLKILDQKVSGKAIARIEQINNRFYISIGGKPFLRAILYESLVQKKQKKLIKELLKTLQISSISVVLNTRQESFRSKRDELPYRQESKLTRNGIQIDMIYNENLKNASGGIALGDKLAEKRRNWEKARLSKLRNSKAFRRRLNRQSY